MTDRIVRVILRGDIAGFSAAMAKAKADVVATGTSMTAATKDAEKYRAGLGTLGSQAGKVGLVAAVGLGVAVKAATDFNEELALVQSLSHASATEMDRLSEAALTVGKNIGYSAKAVAQGEEELIKAGVAIDDILGGALKGSLDLAAAGQTDVATATSIAAAALTEFGLAGKDVPHIADLLAAGADKALGSVEDLGYGLTQSGTTAAQMGLSIEQTVGALAAFAQAGLTGERGGTTFKQMLLQLAAPTAKAADLMKKFNISLYDNQGQIKTIPQLADNLRTSLEGIDPAARNAALGVIFGSRAIQGANILMANGAEGISDWIAKVDDQGFAAEQAGGKLDSLAGDVKKFGAALNAALIEGGDGSQGALRGIVQGATDATNALNDLPAGAKNTVSGLLAITAVTGGALWFGSKVIRSVSDTRAALEQMGTTGARVGRTLRAGLAVGSIIAGLDLLDTALDSIFNRTLDQTKLNRSLQALSQGRITGELSEKFGKDLEDFGDEVAQATAGGLTNFQRKLPDFIGDNPFDKSEGPKQAAENIAKLDEALASLVDSGQGEQAAAMFETLQAAAIKGGASTGAVTDAFDQYLLAVKNAAGATHESTTATEGNTAVTTVNVAAQDKLTEALLAQRKAARETAEGFVGLGQNVDNAKVSLDDWIRGLNIQAKALEEFADNAVTAGKRGLRDGLIKELEEAGPEGALRLKQLADGTKAQIAEANAAFDRGRKAVHDYTNEIGGIPQTVPTVLSLQDKAARDAIAQFKALMASLHDKTVRLDFYVNQVNTYNKPKAPSLERPDARAPLVITPHDRDGDPKTPFWSGGYTGEDGGIVHRREFVMSEPATSGNLAQLHSLHEALKSGKSFATAVSTSVSAGGGGELRLSDAHIEQLARAMASVRSLTGPVTVMDGRDFGRILAMAEANAALSGMPSSP